MNIPPFPRTTEIYISNNISCRKTVQAVPCWINEPRYNAEMIKMLPIIRGSKIVNIYWCVNELWRYRYIGENFMEWREGKTFLKLPKGMKMLSDVNRIDEKTVELVDPLQGWQRRTCTRGCIWSESLCWSSCRISVQWWSVWKINQMRLNWR